MIEHIATYRECSIIIKNNNGRRTFRYGNMIFRTMLKAKAYIDRILNADK